MRVQQFRADSFGDPGQLRLVAPLSPQRVKWTAYTYFALQSRGERSPGLFRAVYVKDGNPQVEDKQSLAEAVEFLNSGAELQQFLPLGVWQQVPGIIHFPQSGKDKQIEEAGLVIRELCKIGAREVISKRYVDAPSPGESKELRRLAGLE